MSRQPVPGQQAARYDAASAIRPALSMLTRQFVSHVTLRRETVTAFDADPFSLPAVRALNTLELHPKVTFLVGENGSGKSTLMEAIAVALVFNAEGG